MEQVTGIIKILEFLERLGFDRIPEIDISHLNPKNSFLENLKDELGDCRRCRLAEKRRSIVFGEGSLDAQLMFIGEAPGEEEDRQGRPFVGEAGQLLTRLIEKMGFKREELYITNVVKCRPPGNRTPERDEIETCLPFLKKQIEIIKPSVIMTLGGVATKALLFLNQEAGHGKKKEGITEWRGKVYHYQNIPLVPTFHPAYLLRNPKDKKLTWHDAQLVLRILKGESSVI